MSNGVVVAPKQDWSVAVRVQTAQVPTRCIPWRVGTEIDLTVRLSCGSIWWRVGNPAGVCFPLGSVVSSPNALTDENQETKSCALLVVQADYSCDWEQTSHGAVTTTRRAVKEVSRRGGADVVGMRAWQLSCAVNWSMTEVHV